MNEENLKAIREKLSKEMEKSTENVADLDQNLLKEKLAEQETVAIGYGPIFEVCFSSGDVGQDNSPVGS